MANNSSSNGVELLCLICFCPMEVNEPKYRCVLKCSAMSCQECLEALISYSENNNLLPSCPSNSCNGIYIISELQNISTEAIKSYEYACLNYMLRSQGDNVKKRVEQEIIISKLREDRLKFLETKFPKAVSLVAKLTFKEKLRRLDKQKSRIINLQMKNANRSCLNSTCNGFLDPNFVCITCLTEFCKQCEKNMTDNHECKQEDLESVNLVNGLIHCPGCKLPVFKDVGCDSITCANCNTNFLYSTGKKGGHGSSNAKINITTITYKKISNSMSELIPTGCLELILILEALQPVLKSKEILLGPVKYYIKSKNKDVASKQLAKKIDIYTKYKYKNRDYHKYLVEIENMLKQKEESNIIQNRLIKIIDEVK
jgi:hypothetical protein